MQSRSLLVLLSALAFSTASPLRRRQAVDNGTTVTPTLPVTDGSASQLPGPDELPLKHILIGHGIQNYTCAAATGNATSVGALAVLYDVTPLFPGTGSQALSAEAFNSLSSRVLHETDIPLNLAADSAVPNSADPAAPFPAPDDLNLGDLTLPFSGRHYFDSTNTPTFDVSVAGEMFKGKKDLGVTAPTTADKGLSGTGAVDWLKLSDKGTSTGVTLVYRVVTAGGSASPCTAVGQTKSEPYTAQYWMYGA